MNDDENFLVLTTLKMVECSRFPDAGLSSQFDSIFERVRGLDTLSD
jgi:hypothetical protein